MYPAENKWQFVEPGKRRGNGAYRISSFQDFKFGNKSFNLNKLVFLVENERVFRVFTNMLQNFMFNKYLEMRIFHGHPVVLIWQFAIFLYYLCGFGITRKNEFDNTRRFQTKVFQKGVKRFWNFQTKTGDNFGKPLVIIVFVSIVNTVHGSR